MQVEFQSCFDENKSFYVHEIAHFCLSLLLVEYWKGSQLKHVVLNLTVSGLNSLTPIASTLVFHLAVKLSSLVKRISGEGVADSLFHHYLHQSERQVVGLARIYGVRACFFDNVLVTLSTA